MKKSENYKRTPSPLHGELTFRMCVYWFDLFSQVRELAHGSFGFFWKSKFSAKSSVFPDRFHTKKAISDTNFEIAPVSLQSRWGIFFSHKYIQNTFSIQNHRANFSNRNQLGPPIYIYICLTLSKGANSIWITIHAYIVSW